VSLHVCPRSRRVDPTSASFALQTTRQPRRTGCITFRHVKQSARLNPESREGDDGLARNRGDAYPPRTAIPTPNPRPGAHATGIDGRKGAPPREASVHRIVSRGPRERESRAAAARRMT
jgi:hypothetical protein